MKGVIYNQENPIWDLKMGGGIGGGGTEELYLSSSDLFERDRRVAKST